MSTYIDTCSNLKYDLSMMFCMFTKYGKVTISIVCKRRAYCFNHAHVSHPMFCQYGSLSTQASIGSLDALEVKGAHSDNIHVG